MAAFNPDLITNPRLNPRAKPIDIALAAPSIPDVAPAPMIAPAQQAPMTQIVPKPIILPVPVPVKQEKPRTLQISADVARKAQGIYPAEQQAKQNMIENAKAPPSPIGAWGKPS